MERRGSNHKSQITSRQWLDYPQFLSDFAETIQGELEIFPAVGGRDNGPDAGFPPWHGRKPDSLRKYAFPEQPIRQLHRQGAVPAANRRNGAFTRPGIQPARRETALEETRVFPARTD